MVLLNLIWLWSTLMLIFFIITTYLSLQVGNGVWQVERLRLELVQVIWWRCDSWLYTRRYQHSRQLYEECSEMPVMTVFWAEWFHSLEQKETKFMPWRLDSLALFSILVLEIRMRFLCVVIINFLSHWTDVLLGVLYKNTRAYNCNFVLIEIERQP